MKTFLKLYCTLWMLMLLEHWQEVLVDFKHSWNWDLTFLSEVQDEFVLLRREQMEVFRGRRCGPNLRQQQETNTQHQHPLSVWARGAGESVRTGDAHVRCERDTSPYQLDFSPGAGRVKAFIWTLYCTSFICFIWSTSAFDSVSQFMTIIFRNKTPAFICTCGTDW